ncbi:MAG: hypothetical protein JWL73_888 [Actinomycetia bacterium]|nr:hypothetical protein [Actinomycetes bacterium]
MTDDGTPLPSARPSQHDETRTLLAALDYQRAVIRRKVEDLPRDVAGAAVDASEMTALGIVRHLGAVERWWFQRVFAGDDRDEWTPGWTIGMRTTMEQVLGQYDTACAFSDGITLGAPSLDAVSQLPAYGGHHPNLRWILVHMLAETARHAGHLDLIRERIDGRTGD